MTYEILPPASGAHFGARGGEYGEFRRGGESSRWVLSRFLVARIVGDYAVLYLGAGALLLGLAAVLTWSFGPHWLAVIIGLVAMSALVIRALVAKMVNALLRAPTQTPHDVARLTQVARSARADVRAELRRIGLPHTLPTMPLLGLRLLRARTRPATVAALRGFDASRAIEPGRLDELHMLLAWALIVTKASK